MHSFNVGILGATGAVGQKFIRLLQNHPWFSVNVLGASERSAGKKYKDAAHWVEPIDMPKDVADIIVSMCEPEHFKAVDFVFSGLDSSVAGQVERAFAQAGIPVISNAKNYRMDESVPLLIPEVNPDHIGLIDSQSFTSDNSGWIVTNPNCVCVPLAMSLKPPYQAFGIEAIVVTALQSISGAGYPGVPSFDMIGNIVPYIGGEEDKLAEEPHKMLGAFSKGRVEPAIFKVQATSMRVPVVEGHLLSVAVKFSNSPGNIEEVADAIKSYKNPIESLNLPSAPKQPIRIYEEDRYPQPRLHSGRENGMQASIGRLRKGDVFDISYVTLAHNTIRGAAGGAILNAELLVEKGYLTGKKH